MFRDSPHSASTDQPQPTRESRLHAAARRMVRAGREVAATLTDMDSRVAIRATGRWQATTDQPTLKVFESPAYDARVVLESHGLTAGWQLYVATNNEPPRRVFVTPVPRTRAFPRARAEMDCIARYQATPTTPTTEATPCADTDS
jgi:hypothetical protein